MGERWSEKKKLKKKRKKREWNKKLKSKINKERERKRERVCVCACKWNIRKANRYFTTFPIAVNVVFTLFDFFFFFFHNYEYEDRPLIHEEFVAWKNKIGKIKDKIALDNYDCTKRFRKDCENSCSLYVQRNRRIGPSSEVESYWSWI